MHMQGGKRPSKFVQVGEVYHEGDGVHEARVTDVNGHTATLEYLDDGREITVTKGGFNDIFSC
jgi:hypothetical protein